MGMVNNWVPNILDCIKSNHDMKLISNGAQTKHITFYITNYAAKRQHHSSNTSALLAKSLAFEQPKYINTDDLLMKNKKMLQKCANTLSQARSRI
ncbi:hypothetical protein JVU11DRAFT_4236 [Chiua virens]|nr:hypothetical protein JVU11DRAFT_4236 [Chiua virens]